MECQVQKYDLRVKDSRDKQPRVLSQGIGFDIAVQSIMIVTASAGSAWIDLWKYYEKERIIVKESLIA